MIVATLAPLSPFAEREASIAQTPDVCSPNFVYAPSDRSEGSQQTHKTSDVWTGDAPERLTAITPPPTAFCSARPLG
jgi:hypothetical protein